MENLREQSIEKHKETAYIESMANDIAQDTASIQNIIATYEGQIKGIDSLIMVLESPVAQIDYRQMYILTMKYLNKLVSFEPSLITFTQLKNFGGLRLIGNKSVSDSIVDYYSTFDSHVEQQRYTMNFLQETLDLEIIAMNFGAYRAKTPGYNFDQRKFKEFFNRTLLFQSLLDNEVVWMKDYQKQSISVLKHLEKEYKLEP